MRLKSTCRAYNSDQNRASLHTDLLGLWCYKIMFGFVRVDLSDSLVFSSCRPARGHK